MEHDTQIEVSGWFFRELKVVDILTKPEWGVGCPLGWQSDSTGQQVPRTSCEPELQTLPRKHTEQRQRLLSICNGVLEAWLLQAAR